MPDIKQHPATFDKFCDFTEVEYKNFLVDLVCRANYEASIQFEIDLDREDNTTMFRELLQDIYELLYRIINNQSSKLSANANKLFETFSAKINLLCQLFVPLCSRNRAHRGELIKVMEDTYDEILLRLDLTS